MADIARNEWIPEVPFDSSNWADVGAEPQWDTDRLRRAAERAKDLPVGPPPFDVVASGEHDAAMLPFLEALLAAAETGTPTPWRAVLATEGVITDDGYGSARVLDPGCLTWRPLPLTLMAMIQNSGNGHAGSFVCGRIDRIYRDIYDVIGEGVFDTGDYGVEIARLVRDKFLRGVSVDIAPKEVEFRPLPGMPSEFDADGTEIPNSSLVAVTRALLLGATVCPFQAIGPATIEILEDESAFVAAAEVAPVVLWRFAAALNDAIPAGPPNPLLEGMTMTADEFRAAEGFAAAGDFGGGAVLLYPEMEEASALAMPGGEPVDELHVTLAFCPGANPDEMIPVVQDLAARCSTFSGTVFGCGSFSAGDDGYPAIAIPNVYGLAELRTELVRALREAGIPVATNFDFSPHITLGYSAEPQMPPHEGRVGMPLTFSAMSVSSKDGTRVDVPMTMDELTAAAAGHAPIRPPREWFANPKLDEPTPLHVDDDGRVYGHVAQWNVCHIGNPAGPGVCVTAPKSPTGYAQFHLGELITEEGDAIAVGQLTIDTGHAPLGTTPKQAVAHYDSTGTVVAHVRCGEDRHGIWFAGAICPDVGESLLRKFRGAKISGDWRKVNGRIDMIGAHCVNIPGFPIPRPSARLVASAAPTERDLIALVAAGIVGETPRSLEDVQARIAALAARAQGIDAMVAEALGE